MSTTKNHCLRLSIFALYTGSLLYFFIYVQHVAHLSTIIPGGEFALMLAHIEVNFRIPYLQKHHCFLTRCTYL